MTLNETTLKDWFIVTFHDARDMPNRILWGTVQDDPSCRWTSGDWCCTSAILDQTGDHTFITKSTRYTTVGPGKSVNLSVKALIELRAGVSPTEY